jgi:hypothetical protein
MIISTFYHTHHGFQSTAKYNLPHRLHGVDSQVVALGWAQETWVRYKIAGRARRTNFIFFQPEKLAIL